MPDETNHPPREVGEGGYGGEGYQGAFPRTHPLERPTDNLPLELSSFIGREREVAEVEGLLANRRLLTLCGPGGCGKTRLALAVARDLVEGFESGVWLVELAPFSDPELVPQAVASALGVREAPDRSLTEVLVEHLKPKKTLLVLDNCEHLLGGCATLADSLLRACPELEILATSREPLRIAGESSWSVPSLSLPDPRRHYPTGELSGYEAVRLFVERAQAVDSGFALTERNASAVARLCWGLDGIPLAIELAAARVRALTIEQISQRLDDPLGLLTMGSRTAAPRHQTLRAALQWSYGLLEEQERELFGRLSVFVGGWTLAAAETVGGGGAVEARQVLDLLCALVDKSLVVAEAAPEGAGGSRYRMLEPIRQYALELLEEGGGAEEIRRLHAAFYLGLAEEARPQLRAAPQVEWLQTLERENGNLRAAISWAISAGETMMAACLGWALWTFWWIRDHQKEGRRWMEMILPKRDELSPWLRVRATVGAVTMAYGQEDGEAVERYSRELMELSREACRDALGEAVAHVGFGLMATARGDLGPAREHLEEALPLFREADEDGIAAQTHTFLGTVLLLQGNHEEAKRSFEEGLALGRSLGDRVSMHSALFNLAQLALAEGDHEAAFLRFVEGIALSEELGDRGGIAYILEGLGIVAGARGEPLRAARLLGASEALISALGLRGHTFYRPDRSLYERVEAGVRSELGESTFEAAMEEGRAMSPERAVEYAPATVEPSVPPPEDAPSLLSRRETEVLRLVAEGLTDSQVADRLYLSPRTVGHHLSAIYRKMRVPSRAAAAKAAFERGLI